MGWREKLGDIFGDKQGAAAARVRRQIAQHCDWSAIEKDVFPDKGGGAPLADVVDAIIAAKHWALLTPLVAEAGSWVSVIDLIYRKNEFGTAPPGRAQELEDIYRAVKAAPQHGKKFAQSFVETVETWACQHDDEACFDWARGKPEFGPVPALGLAILADRPIEGRRLAMEILSSPEDIASAAAAVDWIYKDHGLDRDIALRNLETWRRTLAQQNGRHPPPAPGGPQPL